MGMKILLSLALLVLVVGLNTAWAKTFDNKYTKSLKKECPVGEVLSDVYSIHSNDYEDRKSRLSCRPVPSGAAPGNCTWTKSYINEYDAPVFFMCPPNEVLAGIESKFNDVDSDRRFKFQCCQYPGYKTSECELTGYLNDFDEVVKYKASNDVVLTGWFSYHDNGFEDRRHKLVECLLSE
ncbi:hypothetical protein RRG08_003867 [Elysia crispata]|uniref:Dermatopontin n=1 Tax=Elysia crispata TaxID=231223 RepID=A0AAE0ZF46_9GAST|nr:hypothetical protein RRG08_003867 [Elysia crispata]